MKDSFRHTPFRREQPPNAQRGSMELWLSYIEKSQEIKHRLCFMS